MFQLFYCIRDDHDLRLVLIAGLICVMASIAAVLLLRHARGGTAVEKSRWAAAAGAAGGVGIWATHFVAVLGYDPGVVVGYQLSLTLLSLLVCVAATTAGFLLALQSTRLAMRGLAGVLVGLGIAAMHFVGMYAVEFPGEFLWSAPYVASSIAFAILPTIPALNLALDRDSPASAAWAGLLFVLAIVLLHFTGMAGITILPSQLHEISAAMLSPLGMGIAVAAATLGLLALCMASVMFSARARSAIRASEREFNILVQGISDCAIYMLSEDGRIASWNAGAERLKGYSAAEAIGMDVRDFCPLADRSDDWIDSGLQLARRNGRFHYEGWRYRKDTSRFWAHVTIEAVYDTSGDFHGYAKITRDMSRFKEDQDRLQEATSNLDAALSNMHQGLCLFDKDEQLVISNDRVSTIFGVGRDECPPGTSFRDVFRLGLEKRARGPVPPAMLDEVMDRHRSCLTKKEGGTLIVPFTETCTLAIAHSPMPGGGWVTTFDDITDRRRAEQRIEHMALHDDLTGLPNRAHFTARLVAGLRQAERRGERLAVIGIDLDRFKEVNDLHGHAAGDAVLKLLSERMNALLDGDELVARFGGDEFAALKPYREDSEVADFVERLHTALSGEIEHDGLTIYPDASLGVAIYPTDGTKMEQMLNNADLAMYRAKETVGRQICYYERGMDETARARRMLANDLREAIGRDELSLAYQVQRSVTDQEITGYEALLHWRHRRDGWISPEEFIPIAEESGEILRIGEWVLRAACKDAAQWNEPWRVAVNLSPVQLIHVDLVKIVHQALVESGLAAHRLELEITETAFVADKVRALHVLRQIKALGVTIAIDDFGTGYSSLDTLNSFPFDKIKIDKSFLLESATSHQARAIIRAVLALGRSLEVPVLAEGLESEDQLRLLQSEGCHEAQGYYWGRPMPLPLRHIPLLTDQSASQATG